jgi:branched-chain amino acid transport system permease protein
MALLLAEEVLSSYTEHWMILLGPLLIIVVLCGRNGIYGLLMKGARQ